jgi:hypothetical protein
VKSTRSRFRGRRWLVRLLPALLAALAGLGLQGDSALAEGPWDADSGRTQGGARIDFSSREHWNLKGENLSPRGRNPLYYPLEPGFRFIMEYPDHPWGHLRIEFMVLDKTEPFDVPGLGKFECAVVQEEEFLDGVWNEQAHNWTCIDQTTRNIYAFGEVSWEVDQIGRKVFAGTWRVGEPDGNGTAEPGLVLPGTFGVGAKYLLDGHEVEAYSYQENMETGITVTVPAGTFKDCVRTREYSLIHPSERPVDSWWCPGVGLVKESADGELVASDGLPGTDMSGFGKYHRNPVKAIEPPVAKVTGQQAAEIARKKVAGKVTSVKIERLGKHNVYTVEILADEGGVETDVFVDLETGEVVGTD